MQMTRTSHATLLANHLILSRRNGWSFERAWKAAVNAHPTPDEWPMPDTERFMRAGYYRQRVGRNGGNNMSAIMIQDNLYVDHAYRTPERDPAYCGSGEDRESGGCRKPAREGGWLCEDHARAVHEALARSSYRGKDEVAFGVLGVAA